MRKETKTMKTVERIEPAYLAKRDASNYAAISPRQLDRVKARGDLPYYRVGQKVVFAVADLDRYMKRFRVDVDAALAGGATV